METIRFFGKFVVGLLRRNLISATIAKNDGVSVGIMGKGSIDESLNTAVSMIKSAESIVDMLVDELVDSGEAKTAIKVRKDWNKVNKKRK